MELLSFPIYGDNWCSVHSEFAEDCFQKEGGGTVDIFLLTEEAVKTNEELAVLWEWRSFVFEACAFLVSTCMF